MQGLLGEKPLIRIISRYFRPIAILVVLCLLVTGGVVASALADDSEQLLGVQPTRQDLEQAVSEGGHTIGPSTDSEAANQLAHQDLDRNGVIELLSSVFGDQLQGAAGPYSDLDVEKFLSANVAVVNTDPPSGEDESETQEQSGSSAGQPLLLESPLPLRAEEASGQEAAVDLGLEHSDGELQPANPLVEVGVPGELGEGVLLPESGVTIQVAGAPEGRAPSTVADSAAVYPNVDRDMDFVVAPTPTGVETLTHLRTADAPRTQTYDLTLPTGASLRATDDGGAIVVHGDETLVSIPPPFALDAESNEVSVSMNVSGSSIVLAVAATDDSAYPILVDPVFDTYDFFAYSEKNFVPMQVEDVWTKSRDTQAMYAGFYRTGWQTGIRLTVTSGLTYYLTPWTQAGWSYYVPRYTTDFEKYGVRPTTYINNVTLPSFEFYFNDDKTNPSRQFSPYFQGGLWDTEKGGWVALGMRTGIDGQLKDPSFAAEFLNPNANVSAKNFYMALVSNESAWNPPRQLSAGQAVIELTDNDSPGWGSIISPSGWVNNEPTAPIPFRVSDPGLGVYKITVQQPWEGGTEFIETKRGCVGGALSPCPREWSNSETKVPQIAYDPSAMPTGENWIKVSASDPLGHKEAKPAEVRIKVDHTPPSLALTGTITEQGFLGSSRPSYELEVTSSDGTTEKPQSGVSKTKIEVDGKVVNESAPGCTTQNCTVSRKWTLDASLYAAGQHLLKVVATDAVGFTTAKSQSFKLQPTDPPEVGLAGSATQQATLGTSRPRYVLKTNASTSAGFNGAPVTPATFDVSFGGTGTGKGQFNGASGTAVDSKGNLWVVDGGGGRVEGFNAKGEFLSQFGEPGSNPGQLKWPAGLAIDGAGDFWVTSGDGRIQEFSSAGKFIKQFGKEGSADGAFKNPQDIAIDSKGSLWILEYSRVQVLDQEGKFLFKFGTQGKGNGQLSSARGIAIAPDGSVWVADTSNHRLQKFNSKGEFLAAYGEEGTGNGNLWNPYGIRIDQTGNLYVADGGNKRVQVFNAAGEYLTQFGSAGTGPGQFYVPSYLSIDASGSIWVNAGADKIQRWHSQAAPPTFSAAFGSKGTGPGQFTTPSGVAADSTGNVWVVDRSNSRIEKFDASGAFLGQYGSKGTGAGQLSSPWGITIDPSGNAWVTDVGNVRVVEYNSKGDFVATFGSNVNKTKVEAGGTQAEKNLCTAASKHVCQAGTAGSLEGQLKQPTGIAASPSGDLFVVEKGNGRVEKFSPTGKVLAAFGKPGTAEGQLLEPSAVAISPDGNYLWVADSGNSRIQEWSSTYSFVRSVGEEDGVFEEPYGLTIDAKGNVWVADTYMNRIQGFNAWGDFLTKFGTSGAGEGQLSAPYSLTAGQGGSIWVADTGHNQIQKWIPPTSKASTITSEITIDGKAVSTKVGRCGMEACAIASEWILQAGSYAVGKHTIQVKATDGLGRSTTKTVAIELQKDATNPTIEASGGLVSAPGGWVEQQSYGLNATATDAGYGVTSLVARIDGQQVASWTGSCLDGGCEATISKSMDMSAYSGGSHPAEVIATDGAGNTAKRSWTINVDPDGHITTQEATATLEAVEDTSTTNSIGASQEEEEIPGTAEGLGLTQGSGGLAATGTEAPAKVSTSPGGSFTVEVPEGWEFYSCLPEEETVEEPENGPPPTPGPEECSPAAGGDTGDLMPIDVAPLSVAGTANATTLVEENAAVSGNTSTHVDTVVRPLYDGALTFTNIRDSAAPEQYSWKVNLAEDQELKLIDAQHAQVYYKSGHPAFGITAVPAHDAIGTAVPTSLSVSGGNIVTLNVQFKNGSFVYPIIAGTGWQGGFVTYEVQMPPPEAMPGEEEEEWEELDVTWVPNSKVGRVRLGAQGPPVARPNTNGTLFSHRYKFSECRFRPDEVEEVPMPDRRITMLEIEGNCMREAGDKILLAGMSLRGWYWYKPGKEIWVNNSEEECKKWGPLQPAMIHCEAVPSRDPHHVVLYGNYKFPCCSTVNLGFQSPECNTLWAVLTVAAPHKHERENLYEGIDQGDSCDWPQR